MQKHYISGPGISETFQAMVDAHRLHVISEMAKCANKALYGHPEGSTVAIRLCGDGLSFEYQVNAPGDHVVPDPRFMLLGRAKVVATDPVAAHARPDAARRDHDPAP